jgi:hypothetical protein
VREDAILDGVTLILGRAAKPLELACERRPVSGF